MGYLYKLIDEQGLENSKNNIITLSHPIFEFKGSEGKIINFAKRIYDRYLERGLNIEPTEKDLAEIKKWCEIYKTTYGKGFNDWDINSESMIIFCGIMQAFCGYFTTENLFDESIRNSYMSKGSFKNKKAVIRIDEKSLAHLHWRSINVNGNYEKYYGSSDDYHDFNGFLHLIDISYNANFDDYNELLKIYNQDELRRSSNWFSILSKDFEWQKEKRLLFLLRSLEPNSSRIGCNKVYKPMKKCTTWEEVVFGNVVDAIDYYRNGPCFARFASLKLEKDAIQILNNI